MKPKSQSMIKNFLKPVADFPQHRPQMIDSAKLHCLQYMNRIDMCLRQRLQKVYQSRSPKNMSASQTQNQTLLKQQNRQNIRIKKLENDLRSQAKIMFRSASSSNWNTCIKKQPLSLNLAKSGLYPKAMSVLSSIKPPAIQNKSTSPKLKVSPRNSMVESADLSLSLLGLRRTSQKKVILQKYNQDVSYKLELMNGKQSKSVFFGKKQGLSVYDRNVSLV